MENVWKNDLAIDLNILYFKENGICPAYVSKINSNCEKQIIILMTRNEEKERLHYLTVKQLSALLYGITSNHKGRFYCLKFLHSLKHKINLNLIKKYVKIKMLWNCNAIKKG